jgi:cysteine desulfurase
MIFGGAQERNMRGGTENLYGIVGLAKAFEIAYRNMDIDRVYILELKSFMIQELRKVIPTAEFHGETSPENSLYTVLNVSFPPVEIADMLLFNLDIAGISASGGSACSSGSNIGSHVLRAIGADPERPAIRFSFSKFNTKAEILYTVERLKELFYSR